MSAILLALCLAAAGAAVFIGGRDAATVPDASSATGGSAAGKGFPGEASGPGSPSGGAESGGERLQADPARNGNAAAGSPSTSSDPVALADCPEPDIPVGPGWELVDYGKQWAGDAWKYRASGSTAACAEEFLHLLEPCGGALIEAGYLDMSGSAWGCVYALPDEAGSATVTVMESGGGLAVSVLECRTEELAGLL